VLLYSYAVMCCCIVMPAGTVSLFCRNHSIDVYCHMLLQLHSLCHTSHGKIANSSVPPRWLRKQSGLRYIAKHVRRPAIAGPSVDSESFVLYSKPCVPLHG